MNQKIGENSVDEIQRQTPAWLEHNSKLNNKRMRGFATTKWRRSKKKGCDVRTNPEINKLNA